MQLQKMLEFIFFQVTLYQLYEILFQFYYSIKLINFI